MARNQRDNNNALALAIATTNYVEDLAFDADTATLGDVADVLATVIKQLQDLGILNGTTAA